MYRASSSPVLWPMFDQKFILETDKNSITITDSDTLKWENLPEQ